MNKSSNLVFFALFAAISILLFYVFAPFLNVLILAAVFSFLLQKPYENLVDDLHGRRTIAAVCMVILTLFFCIVPLFFLATQIFTEAQSAYLLSGGSEAQYVQTVQNAVLHFVQRFYPGFTFNFSQYIGNALAFISTNLAGLVSGTVYIIFQTFLMLMAYFFFLRDGHTLVAAIRESSPFEKRETDEIFTSITQTTTAVLKGTLLVAAVRLVLISAAFYFFGIPNATLWGSVGGIVGAIPGIGSLLVFVPAVLYLYISGSTIAAIGLGIFGLAVIALVDNLLTTYFFGKGLEVPQIFVLFSILGGVLFFGPIGFVLGPLVLSVFLSLFTIYGRVTKV